MEDSIRIGEDAAVVFPVFFEAENILVLDESHYHYCLRNESMMWRREAEEKEFSEILLLHKYLEGILLKNNETHIFQQLKDYTMNNILVRAFGVFAKRFGEDNIFLPEKIRAGDSVIIYGAGALGRAIYQYLDKECVADIKGWVDQSADIYQKMGLSVIKPEKVQFRKEDKILIAVLQKETAKEIQQSLLKRGINERQFVEVAFKDIFDRRS